VLLQVYSHCCCSPEGKKHIMITTDPTESGSFREIPIEIEARAFLNAVMRYYPGDLYDKIASTERHLIELLLSLQSEIFNPFDNRGRTLFRVAKYSMEHLIPDLKKDITERNEGGPLMSTTWN